MADFPDRNPNPVLHVAEDGTLVYANPASGPVLETVATVVGERVPADLHDRLLASAASDPPQRFELDCGLRTFAILAVPARGGGVNAYGSDITGEKVVAKFPDRNPHPVIRITPDGRLAYANAASRPIQRILGLAAGGTLAADLHARVRSSLAGEAGEPIEVQGDGRVYSLTPVAIPEFGLVNLYGVDVTAAHAINKFPDENPHPVLRVSRSGRVTYANPASEQVRRAIGVEVGDELPSELMARVRAITDGLDATVVEVTHGARVFELRVVGVFEYESINIYGTDVTAAREVERLLLNILPASIAARLRAGEEPIADNFDELAVLFADVVDFTPFSAARPARDVVTFLNEVFSTFDGLVERHRLEKIKTVGDAYMVVGGITPEAGGVEAVADMALDMIEAMRNVRSDAGSEMQIRVGLQVGPGIGGVIGLKKFIYDVWGDTVNTASRMESHGVPGCIQVTAETARRLGDAYRFEPRGTIEVKGKGLVETSFLLGRA